MTTKALKVFFIVDIGVILFCLLSGRTDWLLNTQIAFFSSLMVTLGSYMGYKRNIEKRAHTQSSYDDGYDELDQMDDQFDLYSPDVPQDEVKEQMSAEEIKEEIAKSKKALKKNNLKNFAGGMGGMASLYRLAGYAGLVIGFFYLNNNGYLHIFSYIFGFIIVPVSALILQFIIKKEETN
jgi:hypothetical protein